MKSSTNIFLSTMLLLSSSAIMMTSQHLEEKINKPHTNEDVKSYIALVNRYEQSSEDVSNEFMKSYLSNMNFLQEKNPQIANQAKEYTQRFEAYQDKKSTANGLKGLGIAGIVGSYLVLLGAAKPKKEDFVYQN